jgi:hypothetical protein
MALLTSKSTVEDVSEVLDRDGVVVIEDLVGDTTLKDLWADLGPALDDVVYGDNNFSGQRTKRLHRRKRRHGVLPGSHRWEPERDPRPTEAASAVLCVGGSPPRRRHETHRGGSRRPDDRVDPREPPTGGEPVPRGAAGNRARIPGGGPAAAGLRPLPALPGLVRRPRPAFGAGAAPRLNHRFSGSSPARSPPRAPGRRPRGARRPGRLRPGPLRRRTPAAATGRRRSRARGRGPAPA